MPILVHYSLILDFAGYRHVEAAINEFIQQADLTDVEKTVETIGKICTIRFTVKVAETLPELRLAIKNIPTGLFSDKLKLAVKTLKEDEHDIYLELSAHPPLHGINDRDLL